MEITKKLLMNELNRLVVYEVYFDHSGIINRSLQYRDFYVQKYLDGHAKIP